MSQSKGYPKAKIQEFSTIKGGKRIPLGKTLVTERTEHPYIRARDIGEGIITFNDPVYVTNDVFETIKNYTVKTNDVCITIVGAYVGDVGIVPPFLNGANLTENAVKLTKLVECDPFYLKYCLLTEDAQSQMKLYAAGAAQPKLGLYKIKEVEIPFPDFVTQRKIASILRAYDDFIENSTRRIQILKEMARRIYDEWFVRFRFPGHENIEMVESELGLIPEGWRVQPLEEILSTLEAGSRPKGGIDPKERGIPSIGAENINGLGNYDFSKERYVSSNFYEQMRRGKVKSEDVMLYKDGAYIGRKALFRDGYPHEECAVNEHVFILRTDGTISQTYLYFWLELPDMTSKIKALNANAAQPGINQVGVKSLPILIPSKVILNKFIEQVEPCLALLFNLAKKNLKLRATKDLLLPKLISGEIDVSNFPEPVTNLL